MSEKCVILMCNSPYLDKTKNTILQLRTIGEYKDDIVLLVGDDLKNLSMDNVIVKYFPNIDRSDIIEILKNKPVSLDGREFSKSFQWHKIHIFDLYFNSLKKIGSFCFNS